VDWTNPSAPVIYAVTTNSNSGYAQNSIVSFTASVTGESGGASIAGGPTVLATAPANEAFRGVALAPTAPPASVSGTTATTTTLTATSGTYPNGSLSATVAPAAGYSGSNTPTGWVSFQSNGVEIGSAPLNGSGVATLAPSSDIDVGTYSVVAVYTGDANFATSSSTLDPVAITQGTPTVTQPTYPTGSTGHPVTLSATVVVPAGTTPAPDNTLDGTVTFWIGTPYAAGSIDAGTAAVAPVISPPAPGTLSFQASVSYTFNTSATYTIYAVYSGNNNFASAQISASLFIAQSTTTVVTSNMTDPTAAPSQNVTLYATVYGNGTSAPTPGTVAFTDEAEPVTETVQYLPQPAAGASFTGSISGNTLSVSAVGSGTLAVGDTLSGLSIPLGTSIIAQTGGTAGGIGTYTLSSPQSLSVSSETIGTTPTLVAYVTVPTGTLENLSSTVLVGGVDSIVANYSGQSPYAASSGTAEQTVQPQPFGAGDVLVYRIGDGSGGTLFTTGGLTNAVLIDEYNPYTDALVQSIAMPTSSVGSVNALTQNSNFGAGGILSVSADGNSVEFAGDTDSPGGTASTSNQDIAVLNVNGSLNTSTVDTGAYTVRSVASVNGTTFYEGSSSGAEYTTLGASGASTPLTASFTGRVVEIENNQLYISSDTSTVTGVGTVGTGLPTSGTNAVTALPGLTAADFPGFGPYNYFFATLNPGDTSPDTLYVASSVQGIYKFSLVNGSWTPSGEVPGTATNEYAGLTGFQSNGVVTLYATDTVQFSATTGGDLVSLVDNTGFNNAPAAFSALTPTTIAVAANNTNIHGVSLVPGFANVTVSKTADQAAVAVGATDGYTVTITNTGTDTANGVTLSDPLPAGVTWSINGGANASSFQITSDSLVLNGVSSLLPGQSLTVHITGTTTATGNLVNTATVNATYEQTYNQQAQATILVGTVPTVTNPSNQTVAAGGNTSFSVSVTGTPAPSVQWEFWNGVGSPNFMPVSNGGVYSGATTTTLTITGATAGMNGYEYEAFVENPVGQATSQAATLTVTSGTAPAISSVVVNGGAPAYIDENGLGVSLAGQNSVVEQILVTFNEQVTLDPGAFTITNNAAGVTVNAGPAPNTLAVTAIPTPVASSGSAATGYSQYIITFSGPGTTAIPGGAGNVIDDGLYILNTIGSHVHANSQTAANNNTGFWALYGSVVNADNIVSNSIGDGNSEVFVDNGDFSQFRNTFGSESDIPAGPPAYNVGFDSNLDGFVDNSDFSKFRTNFGADWSF
jgi:uncharacterized repeat protein (TIGR01451 family)